MQIRPYRTSDLPTLSRIDQRCFPPGIAYSREELAGYIRHRSSVTWVAEAEDSIIGFIVVSRQPARIGHIITIDVVEQWRGRGVGSALMAAADEWARQAKLELIYLETAEDNIEAQKFYEKQGYRRIDRVERYYSDDLAAWVMVKRLG